MSIPPRQQHRFWLLIAFAIVTYAASFYDPSPSPQPNRTSTVQDAYSQQRSDVQLEMTGFIKKILPDDNTGSRHQKFIVEVASGLTILVAHNIDLAPPIASLQIGQEIILFGEYEWTPKGGVLHWTHHDPNGRHPNGWVDYQGHRYQ